MNEPKPAGGTALARREDGTAIQGVVLTNPEEYHLYRARKEQEGAHMLSPVTDIGSMPANWVFIPSAVYLNPNPTAGDVYQDRLFCKEHEVAPTKVGLRKIAKAAGISWVVKREDSGHVANYWAMKCTIEYRGHDGLPKHEEASYEWDLRDGSARVSGMSPRELNKARVNGYRRCEAGAINAAIREYGLKQKYTKDEITRPFVVFNLVFKPENDEQKNMLAQAALGGANLLYGGTTAALPPADNNLVDKFTGEDDPPEEPLKGGPAALRSFDDVEAENAKAAADKGQIVTNVGVSGSDYYITVEGGKVLHTTDKGIAATCNIARRDKTPIVISAELRGEQLEILEVEPGMKY
jgi:hypothetical protein